VLVRTGHVGEAASAIAARALAQHQAQASRRSDARDRIADGATASGARPHAVACRLSQRSRSRPAPLLRRVCDRPYEPFSDLGDVDPVLRPRCLLRDQSPSPRGGRNASSHRCWRRPLARSGLARPASVRGMRDAAPPHGIGWNVPSTTNRGASCAEGPESLRSSV
jgi:hypothetical protein